MFEKFNRIKVVKELIIQKLDDLISKLNTLDTVERGVTHLAENQTVILKSLSHLINFSTDLSKQLVEDFQSRESHLKESLEDTIKQLFRYQLQEGYLKDVFDKILDKLNDSSQIKIELTDQDNHLKINDIDVRLMAFLYSFLPDRVAVDVGANIGNVSEILLASGYEVYAFEPYVPTFAKLTSRLNNHSGFYCFDCAVGSHDGEMDLYLASDTTEQGFYQEPSLYNTLSPHSMPAGLEFTEKVSVQVRTVQSLQESGEIPSKIGLLKIDTEGYDLDVIRGCNDNSIPVIVSEFWDEHHVFAKFDKFNALKTMVEEMRKRNYYWYIVIARKDKKNSQNFAYDTFYYCNFPVSLYNTWGNVFFFNEYALFEKALEWCSAMLPLARFC